MGQLLYYCILIAFMGRWLTDYPWLLGTLLVLYLLRGRLPDPWVYFRTAGRIRSLKIQIAQNADNAIARRDLAMVWLERRRPRRAIQLLEEARRRDSESAELSFLLALAYTRTGRHEDALPLLVDAQARDPKLRYGEIYLVAGIALAQLGRDAEAEDALLRFLKINASSVEGWVRLARLRRRQKDEEGAKAALLGAVEAFEQSPKFRRRREFGWYVRAQLARVF
jgi:tetratricopeptide (TPR) repeat protein